MQNVDAFGKSVVSALVSPGNTKLLLLHSNHKQSEEATRMFLVEAGELYMKVCRPSAACLPRCAAAA